MRRLRRRQTATAGPRRASAPAWPAALAVLLWGLWGTGFLAPPAGAQQASAAVDESAPGATRPATEPARRASRAATAPDFGSAEVGLINERIAQAWAEHELGPSRAATDGEWCRRVYLDLLGRIPTVEELRAYTTDRARDKRRKLVDRLLGDEYRDEYARHWSTVWANLLIGRTGGTDRDSLAHRGGMEEYLREAFQYNKPYDELARELITATGSARPGDDDFNGAVNFLADKMGEGGVQATAKTSQIFLGMAVQCTQCHGHPFNDYQQNQFWELNAFFRQTRVERLEDGERRRVARVIDRDFAGEGGDPSKAELFYELRNGRLRVAYPVFIDGTSLAGLFAARGEDFGDRGYVADVNRRQELSRLVLESREFDRAIVNRMWAHFFSYGFTKPLDDIGPHNAPSHPKLLDELGSRFREGGFDLRALARWIALSEPYGLSSQIGPRNKGDEPTLGARPMFSRFYLRQMEAEQLYESLLVATAAADTLRPGDRETMKRRWLDQFSTAFGTDENDEANTFNGTIPQALTLMNGELMRRATGKAEGSMLSRVAGEPQWSNADKINYLYQAAVSRRPTRAEIAICNELLAARRGNVGEALQDIWWALLNSNEFILIH